MCTAAMGQPKRPSHTPKTLGSRPPPPSTTSCKDPRATADGTSCLSPVHGTPPVYPGPTSATASGNPRPRGNSTGPGTLHRWHHQKPIEEPWNGVSRRTPSRRTSKTCDAISQTLSKVDLSTPVDSDRAVIKGKTGGSGSIADRRSNLKAVAAGTNKNARAHGSDAGAARGGNAPRIKHGQIAFTLKVPSYFACFCCKRQALAYRAMQVQDPGAPLANHIQNSQVCQCVKDERSVRRTSAGRHRYDSEEARQGDSWSISPQSYGTLNGDAYRDARDLANRRGLNGRPREEFLWREGFVCLYPAYQPVAHLLNPFGYDDPMLDIGKVCQLERQQSPAPSPAPTYAQVAASTVAASTSRTSPRPDPFWMQPNARGILATNSAHQSSVQGSQASRRAPQLEASTSIGSRGPFSPPPYFDQPPANTPQDSYFSVQALRTNSMMMETLPWDSGTSAFHSGDPIHGVNDPMATEYSPLSEMSTSHQHTAAVPWRPSFSAGSISYAQSVQGTGYRTPSSQQHPSTPSFGHRTDSTRTGHSSRLVPQTPADPGTPTPHQQPAEETLSGLGTVNPKDLMLNPEGTDFSSDLDALSRQSTHWPDNSGNRRGR